MPTTGDIRQVAGLLEGEGSFGFANGALRIKLSMTDLDVVDQARTWSEHRDRNGQPPRIGVYQPRRGRPIYTFHIIGVSAAAWMMMLYQFLGQRRRAQIRSALAAWRERPISAIYRTHCPRGHPYDLILKRPKGKTSRGCRRCRNDQLREYSRRYMKAWRAEHPERVHAINQRYYKKHLVLTANGAH